MRPLRLLCQGFSVSPNKIELQEGKSVQVMATSGGAQKLYWIIKRDGSETLVEVDRLKYKLMAGRVTGDQALTLQLNAVYPDEVKTLDIPSTIREDIPDPLFNLMAPSKRDGRETIESVFLKVYADDKLIRTERQTVKADKAYAFTVKLKAGFIKYKVEFATKAGGAETVLNTVTNLVCGDAFIIQGQSNVVDYNYYGVTNNPFTKYSSDWIRSCGGHGEAGGDPTGGGWGNAVIERLTPKSPDRIHFIGVWGMALAANLKYYYLFQVFAAGCGTSGTFTSDMLREEQRTLPRLYSNMRIMSTLAFPSGIRCHFNLTDYTRMGEAMAAMVARDNYSLKTASAVTAPNLQNAYFTGKERNEITLVFDQPMAWNPSATVNFYLDRQPDKVVDGGASGNVIKLQVTGAVTNQTIAYVVDQHWRNNTNLIYGVNGIAALTFYAVPIEFGKQGD